MLRKVIGVLFGLLGVVIVVLLILQLRAKQMVEDFLDKKIPPHIILTYTDMDINILTGTIGFENVAVTLSNRDTILAHTEIVTDRLTVNDLGYLNFFYKNTISADEILVDKPELTYYQHRKFPNKDTLQKGVVNLLKTIVVDKITIEDGKFQMLKNEMDSVQMKVAQVNFNLYNAKIDPDIIQRKIPISYDTYKLLADSIYVDLGPYEELTLGHLNFEENTILFKDIRIDSKYSKVALSKELITERDFIALEIPEFGIDEIDFGFRLNRFFIAASNTWVSRPNLLLYRDKLVADDKTHKALYANSLRELPIDIQIDTVLVKEGHFEYEESVSNDNAPGNLIFENLEMAIGPISNLSSVKTATKVNTTSLLMGSATLELDLEFDVMNERGAFLASGSLSDYRSSDSNSFLVPSLNIEAEGEIEQLYFTVSGDSVSSSGDLKMKYHDFKFKILDKDSKGVRKFWTTIGNLFINDGSKTDTDGYRHGNITVTRDPTKSFFNYIWLNIKEGLLKALIGDGKKE